MAPKILFVENDPIFASTLEDALKQKGYRLVKAASVQEAHSKIQKQRGIKAAVIDVRMEEEKNLEDWSGLILARWIAGMDIPVIILSAYDEREYVWHAFDVAPGVEPPYAFVSKNSPDWQEELSQALKEVIEVRQRRKWWLDALWVLVAVLILVVAFKISPSPRGALVGVLVDAVFWIISYPLSGKVQKLMDKFSSH